MAVPQWFTASCLRYSSTNRELHPLSKACVWIEISGNSLLCKGRRPLCIAFYVRFWRLESYRSTRYNRAKFSVLCHKKQRISQPTFTKTFIKNCGKILKNHTFERKILKHNSRGFESNTLKMTILEPWKNLKKFATNWKYHNPRHLQEIIENL